MNFKPGDRVICIDHDNRIGILEKNKIYTVKYVKFDYFDQEHVTLEENNLSWYSDRFELAYIKEFNDKLDKLID